MSISGALTVLASQGVEVTRYFYDRWVAGATRAELAADTGMTEQWVGSVLAMGKVMFGAVEASLLREHALAVAQRCLLGVEVLRAVNAAVRSLSKQCEVDRWELRMELFQWAEGRTVAEVKAHATARVRELNGDEHTPWRRSLRISAHPDAGGQRHLHLSLADAHMAEVEANLHRTARRLRKHDASLTHSKAMADAAFSLLTSEETQEGDRRRRGMVIIPITGAKHAGSGMLATTDGAQVHFSELADALLRDHGLALFYGQNAESGVPEPVGLAPIQALEPIHDAPGRYANDTQRLVAQADQVLCADPDCHRRAVNCQMHHVDAASRSGKTTQENLVAVCATHHGTNDDDPSRPKNGRYERHPVTGQAGHRRPGDDTVRVNTRPGSENSGRALAARMFDDIINDPNWHKLPTQPTRHAAEKRKEKRTR